MYVVWRFIYYIVTVSSTVQDFLLPHTVCDPGQPNIFGLYYMTVNDIDVTDITAY